MNLELFIAKRIYFSKEKGEKRVSSPAIKIAVAGVAIGLAAMILAVSIVIGFKNEVRNKVIGFGSHIQISSLSDNSSLDYGSIIADSAFVDSLRQNKNFKHIELYANIPGIIKTDSDFQGVMLKGVGEDYDWSFFEHNMVEGSVFSPNDSVRYRTIISQHIANKLDLKLGDDITTYFIKEKNVSARKFKITGIYNTNLEDYDKLFIITDLRTVQRLYGWPADKVTGLEILVNDYNKLDDIKNELFFDMLGYRDKEDNTFYARSIKEIKPDIFGWLELLDLNVIIIILLMLAISVFTMTSGLLIIILENTKLIGILKTMGARNGSIRKTFLYVSGFLVLKGMLWGNIIGFGIIFLQKYTSFIKLDPGTYYLSAVPVEINWLYFILLNLGTLIITVGTMILPSYMISNISPVKTMRFE